MTPVGGGSLEQALNAFGNQFRDEPFHAMCELVDFLDARKRGPKGDWDRTVRGLREHKLHGMLLEDPYTARAFNKPRGYAGDAVMMDFIYGHHTVSGTIDASPDLGRCIARFSAGESAPSRAVRWRRSRVAREIESLVNERGDIEVFAFACGHLREFELLRPEVRDHVRFVAADADAASLETVRASYSREGNVECSRTSVRDLIGRDSAKLGRFDFVYTLGLLDYVSARASDRVIECLWNLLRPNGYLLAANFTVDTRGIGYMEAAMDWCLQYRTSSEVTAWARPLENVATTDVFEDPWAQIAYLLARKQGIPR